MEVEGSFDESRHSVEEDGLLADNDSGSSDNEILSCEDKIKAAIELKEHGNALLSKGDYSTSVETYEKGLNTLPVGFGDEIRVALLCNKAVCYIKMKEWRKCIEAATKALNIEPMNTKALCRRGYSLIRILSYEEGKRDLMRVLEIDPNNKDARKEVNELIKKRKAQTEMDRKSFGGMFEKNCNLYADYEMEMAARKARDEEELKKRKTEWENESDKAEARGEQIDDFDEWNRKKSEKNKEETDKYKEEETEKYKKDSVQSTTRNTSSAKETEAIEVDEDMNDLMGEKKLSYCYFDRESANERSQKDRFKPMKIDDSNVQPVDKGNALSDWNSRGTTWEEKDISAWSCKLIEAKLNDVAVKNENVDINSPEKLLSSMSSIISNEAENTEKLTKMAMDLTPMEMKVTKVVTVTGDASVAVIRGSKRYLYDFEILIEWKAEIGDMKDIAQYFKDMKKEIYTGKLAFTDVSSNQSVGEKNWWETGRLTYQDKKPKEEFITAMHYISSKFREAIAGEVEECVKQLKATY